MTSQSLKWRAVVKVLFYWPRTEGISLENMQRRTTGAKTRPCSPEPRPNSQFGEGVYWLVPPPPSPPLSNGIMGLAGVF